MDPVDYQTLFNIAAAFCSVIFGWILKVIWDALRDLQTTDKELSDKVGKIEVLVAGKYVTREELSREFGGLNGKLDLIFDKLDRKADKQGS